MLTLFKTSHACPEQYDAFDKDRNLVGFLRLRWGHFRAEVNGGTVVYDANTKGDGSFADEEERQHHLTRAVDAIEAQCRLPDKPSLNYTIVEPTRDRQD